jgi:hypothetical protein
MARVRCANLQARPTEFLPCTSLTLAAFQPLVPPFEAAFQAHMAVWRLDGKPRTTRQLRVEKTCPVPTCEDRLFCWFCRNVACSRVWKSASHCFPDTQLLDCAQKTTFATELLCPRGTPQSLKSRPG